MTDRSLHVRVERAERELAVRRLVDRYAHGCDVDDVSMVAGLFAHDGVLLVRDDAYVGEQIVGFYGERLSVPTLHFLAGLSVDERPDGLLDATCGFAAIEMPGPEARIVVGRYTDVIRVEDGQAVFVSRRIDVAAKLER